jgi:ribosomal protein S18 acetylase RimI-like enzyme
MEMVTVEEARADELEEIVDITLAAYAEYEKASSPEFWQRYTQNIRQAILSGEGITVLVAREDGLVKGSVLYCAPNSGAIESDLPEMRLLAIPPRYRNLGLGNLLIRECERRATPSGAMILHTTHLMTTAKAMYERRGYERYEAIDFEPVPGFVVLGFKKSLAEIPVSERLKKEKVR